MNMIFNKNLTYKINGTSALFSTTSIFNMADKKLPSHVKDDISETVHDEYKNTVPKFKEPVRDALLDEPSDSSNEALDKFSSFVTKHSDKGEKVASEEYSKLVENVTEQIKEKYPECSDDSIKERVDKEVHHKLFSREFEVPMLPGQESWRRELHYEFSRPGGAGDQGSDRADSIASNDSGTGQGGATYKSDDFTDQSVVGSPGCSSRDAPSNPPLSSSSEEELSSEANSESVNSEGEENLSSEANSESVNSEGEEDLASESNSESSNSEGEEEAPSHSEFNESVNSDSQGEADSDSQGEAPANGESNNESSNSQGQGDSNGSEENNKRPLSSYSDDNPTKKLDNKQSPLDYVLEKQATEMPDIQDADGGD